MRRRLGFALAGLLAWLAVAVGLNAAFPPDLTKYHQAALLVLADNGRPIAALGSPDHAWRLPTTQAQVDPAFVKALIASEDKRFWLTPGLDPLALLRAAFEDAKAHRIISGGSSITMQVARLLTPHRRDVKGKCLEMLRAVQLAARYSKSDILAMYLTLAPYGGNIEGVQAASWLYFGHDAAHLSPPEIALLVALPRRPEALRPDRHPVAAAQAVAHIYAQQHLGTPPLALVGSITRGRFPTFAPYLALHLWAGGERGMVATSIDANLQQQLASIAAAAADRLGGQADVALLLVRNQDATIAAYIGGAGTQRAGGDIDMVQALRSPGSTLKPFIYGMAFDRNIVTPATLIDDTPLANATYSPANFDATWHGTVPVAVALQQSYNLPAVKLTQAVGPLAVVSALRHAGAVVQLPPGDDHPSLAIALGGAGVKLFDVCALYAGLAPASPRWQLRLRTATAPQPQPAVMSAPSAQEILAILEGLPPPAGTSGFAGRAVAYKTGTSYGFRDAWSFGVSGDWTVGIWVGRPDGTPRPGAFGLNTAAPLLADVFALLPPDAAQMPAPIVVLPSDAATSPGLQHFNADQAGQTRLQILFPPPDATIEVDARAPLALQATGGTAPYRWLVDGKELPPPLLGDTPSWQPPSPGFFRITVVDAQNQSASEAVQVR